MDRDSESISSTNQDVKTTRLAEMYLSGGWVLVALAGRLAQYLRITPTNTPRISTWSR